MGSLIAKDREFSPNENRYLSGAPKFSIAKVMSGEFQDDLEKYLNDQIIGRDQWITVKTAIQKSAGDTDIGGAYVGKNGYDFEKIIPEDIDEKLVNRNIKSVCEFLEQAKETLVTSDTASDTEDEKEIAASDRNQHISFLLVPTSGLVMQEKLPKNAILFDQEKYIDKVQKAVGDEIFIDVRETLQEHANEEIYYRTDHHWTTYGAYLAMQEWNRQLAEKEYDAQSFTNEKDEEIEQDAEGATQEANHSNEISQEFFIEVANDFRGSLYSKILDYNSAYDKIHRLRSSADQTSPGSETVDGENTAEVAMQAGENTISTGDEESCFEVIADGKDIGGFYQEEKLKEKDKYAYFFGGNYGEVAITRTQESFGNLLVIKDSFANAFVPLIADQYDHIYMVDLRYFNNNIQEYIKEKEITDVLVLYNISNFVTDKNIFKLTSK